jgi:hypothetical protein
MQDPERLMDHRAEAVRHKDFRQFDVLGALGYRLFGEPMMSMLIRRGLHFLLDLADILTAIRFCAGDSCEDAVNQVAVYLLEGVRAWL